MYQSLLLHQRYTLKPGAIYSCCLARQLCPSLADPYVVGSLLSLPVVIRFSDTPILIMVIGNSIGVVVAAVVVFSEYLITNLFELDNNNTR